MEDTDVKIPGGVEEVKVLAESASGGDGAAVKNGGSGGKGGAGYRGYLDAWNPQTLPVEPGGVLQVRVGKKGQDARGDRGGKGGSGGVAGGNGGNGFNKGGGGGGGGGSTSITYLKPNGTQGWFFELSGGGGGGGGSSDYPNVPLHGGDGAVAGKASSNGIPGSNPHHAYINCAYDSETKHGTTFAGNQGMSGGGGGGGGSRNSYGCGGHSVQDSSGGGGSSSAFISSDSEMIDNALRFDEYGGTSGNGWVWISAEPTSVVSLDTSKTNLCVGNEQTVDIAVKNDSGAAQPLVLLNLWLESPGKEKELVMSRHFGAVVETHSLGDLPIGKHKASIEMKPDSRDWNFRGQNLAAELNVIGCGEATETAIEVAEDGLKAAQKTTVQAHVHTAAGAPVREGQVAFWVAPPGSDANEPEPSNRLLVAVGPDGVASADIAPLGRTNSFYAEYLGSENFSGSLDSVDRKAAARWKTELSFTHPETILTGRMIKFSMQARAIKNPGDPVYWGENDHVTTRLSLDMVGQKTGHRENYKGFSLPSFNRSEGVSFLSANDLVLPTPVDVYDYTLSFLEEDPLFDADPIHGTFTIVEPSNSIDLVVPETVEVSASDVFAEVLVQWQSGLELADGEVFVEIDGAPVESQGLTNGKGSWPLNTDALGKHTVTATYTHSDDKSVLSANAEYEVTKIESVTTLALDEETLVYGDDARVTAQVSNAVPAVQPEGTVTFYIDDEAITSAALEDGEATATFEAGLFDRLGDVAIHAEFTPSAELPMVGSKSSAQVLTVVARPTTAAATAPESLTYGEALRVEVAVDGDGLEPKGTVLFTSDDDLREEVEVRDGVATLVIDRPGVALHTIEAKFVPAMGHPQLGSVAKPVTVDVQPRATELTLASERPALTVKTSETMRAEVSTDLDGLVPEGTVIFEVDGQEVAAEHTPSRVTGSTAVFETDITIDLVTDITLSARFVPEPEFLESSTEAVFAVQLVQSELKAALYGLQTYGESLSLLIAATTPESDWAKASGAITVTLNGEEVFEPHLAEDGTVTMPFTGLPAGEHSVVIEYPGTDDIAAASFTMSFVVKPAKSSVSIEVDRAALALGEPFSVTTTVNRSGLGSLLRLAPVPADGDVELFVDGASSGTVTLVDGQAEADLPGLSGGAHVVTARYLGNQNHEASEAQVDIEVPLAATTVSVEAAPIELDEGDTTVLTATVGGLLDGFHPAGTVQFFAGDKKLGEPVALSGGVASLPVNDLVSGTHAVAAVFSGDSNYEAAASEAIEVTVAPATDPENPDGDGDTDDADTDDGGTDDGNTDDGESGTDTDGGTDADADTDTDADADADADDGTDGADGTGGDAGSDSGTSTDDGTDTDDGSGTETDGETGPGADTDGNTGPGPDSGEGPNGGGHAPSGAGENGVPGAGSANHNTGQGHLAQTGGVAYEALLLAAMMLLTGASLLVMRRSRQTRVRR
ncbi:Ig-like domain-containing protein [Leucobacter chinensis]|uniref:Ig-like domain-containing protein n=1 Tax=Leucobacter chinensis TaxID=2851010 RepID=UPI001C21E67F